VLFCCKHKDCECHLSCQEHLDNHTLCDAGAFVKLCADGKTASEERIDNVRGSDSPDSLCDCEKSGTSPGDSSNKHHAEGYLWAIADQQSPRDQVVLVCSRREVRKWTVDTYNRIKQATTDTEESLSIDSQTEAAGQRNIQKLRWSHIFNGSDYSAILILVGGDVRNLAAGEGKEEEENGADQFADKCDDVAASRFWEHVEEASEDMFEWINF
jgi:hypothetical protein